VEVSFNQFATQGQRISSLPFNEDSVVQIAGGNNYHKRKLLTTTF